ncbi:sigma 54-interacting transcriptional regulator [Dehalobacter sp. DCM]|uniref:sigma-54 interaction domain-containing protein n=1 Tax=Dehalobacter sp. DCM TaxID=2907827 RepID=UPI00308197D0|nr:sigma 54-interacting transcriptional regulator [Dehalobacter sp. DCM]
MNGVAQSRYNLSDLCLLPPINSKSYWLGVKEAKEKFFCFESADPPSPIVRPEIARSWIRAKKRGLNPYSDYKDLALDEKKLEEKWNHNRILYEVCSSIISSYESLAQSSGFALELFDASGGHLLGSHLACRIIEDHTPPIDWREEKVGTLSQFLVKEYRKPFCLIGPEVLLYFFHDNISFCAPILDDFGKPIASLLLAQELGDSPWKHASPALQRHSLGWVCSLAAAIEGQVSLMKKNEVLRSRSVYSIPKEPVHQLLDVSGDTRAVFTFDDIIGMDKTIQTVKAQAMQFAMSDENILLLGESGTGKELFAQAIHNYSNPGGPFIAVNCSAIPDELIESELFGYEAGAFTGAEKNGKTGKIQLAEGGTLFLDEIGSMPYHLQSVLLRVLQDKLIMRVGGKQYHKVNFRLIAATNGDLIDQAKLKTFRNDLFFRLSVLYIEIPSLAVRGSDIKILANHFIKQYALKQKCKVTPVLSKEAEQELLSCAWPGNVRQLQNTIIYAMHMCTDHTIEPEHLPHKTLFPALRHPINLKHTANYGTHQAQPDLPGITGNIMTIDEMEKKIILEALAKANHQLKVTADLLGISYSALHRRLKKFNIITTHIDI